MAPPCQYSNDEERLEAYKAQQNKYSMQKWLCPVCDCVINLGNKTKHQRSLNHVFKATGGVDYLTEKEKNLWRCEACDIEIQRYSRDNHLKSARHTRNNNKITNGEDSKEKSLKEEEEHIN